MLHKETSSRSDARPHDHGGWRAAPVLCRLLVAWLLLLGGLAWLLFEPYPQPQAYHHFADTRPFLDIPNFGDVVSNAALLLAGLGGLLALRPRRRGLKDNAAGVSGGTVFANPWEAGFFRAFFAALALTAFGSTWYHWAPDNAGLFWDRLPLSLVPMLLPPALLARRGIRLRDALWCAPWLLAGPASVVVWHLGESVGRGDLRFYAVTQLAAVTATAALLVLRPPPPREARLWMAALGLYVLAKLTEHFDAAIFAWGGLASGHTLKHLLAALAAALLVPLLLGRTPSNSSP